MEGKLIQVFENEQFKARGYLDKDGTVRLHIEDVARNLGWVDYQEKLSATGGRKSYEVIRWARVNKYIAEIKANATSALIQAVPVPVPKDSYIPENLVYRLAMKANNELAEKFQAWLADEVIPSIRKTGSYTLPTAKMQDTPCWIETRAHGKITRRKETDVIKIFVEYRKAQGSKCPPVVNYSTLSNLANKAAGIEKGGRNFATIHQLNVIDLVEDMIADELCKGMDANKHYKEILNDVRARIDIFVQVVTCNHKLLRN